MSMNRYLSQRETIEMLTRDNECKNTQLRVLTQNHDASVERAQLVIAQAENKSLQSRIEELKFELFKKDTEIEQLKKEFGQTMLKMKEFESYRDMNANLQTSLDEKNKQLLERDKQIMMLQLDKQLADAKVNELIARLAKVQ